MGTDNVVASATSTSIQMANNTINNIDFAFFNIESRFRALQIWSFLLNFLVIIICFYYYFCSKLPLNCVCSWSARSALSMTIVTTNVEQ